MAEPREELARQVGRFSPDYRAERVNSGPEELLAASVVDVARPVPVRRKVSAADANYVQKGPAPFVCGNCRYIIWGTSRRGQNPHEPDPEDVLDLCQIVEGPRESGGILPEDTCRFWTPKPSYRQIGLGRVAPEPSEDQRTPGQDTTEEQDAGRDTGRPGAR